VNTRQNQFQRYSGWIFVLPFLILFAAFLLTPLLYGLALSFFNWEMLSPAPAQFIGWGNFHEALHSDRFWTSTLATARFVLMATPATVGIALALALGINTIQGRRQAFYRASYFLPGLLSISVAGLLWTWFYNGEFGLFNAYLEKVGIKIPWLTSTSWAMKSIVIMSLWWCLGGATIILLAGRQQISQSLYEAASMDGAGALRSLWHITIPQMRPVLLFVTVTNIIGSFQVFGQTYIITRGGPEDSTRVLVQYIYETAFLHYRMGYGSAMCWLLFAFIAFFSVIQFLAMKERK